MVVMVLIFPYLTFPLENSLLFDVNAYDYVCTFYHNCHIIRRWRLMFFFHRCWCPGPGCSKLTTSLVNVSLKFQTLIAKIYQYFLLKTSEKLLQCKKLLSFLSTKHFSVFGYKVVKHLTS